MIAKKVLLAAIGIYALICSCAFFLSILPAHAAIHADKPVQETVPATSKDKPTCVQSTTIERFIVRDGGKWQRLGGPVTILSECHV